MMRGALLAFTVALSGCGAVDPRLVAGSVLAVGGVTIEAATADKGPAACVHGDAWSSLAYGAARSVVFDETPAVTFDACASIAACFGDAEPAPVPVPDIAAGSALVFDLVGGIAERSGTCAGAWVGGTLRGFGTAAPGLVSSLRGECAPVVMVASDIPASACDSP